MKKYINVSKKCLENKLDKADKCFGVVEELIYDLKQIESFIDLTKEEIEMLENVKKMMINKIDKIDEILENENNEFYEMVNYDCEV